MSFTFVYPCFFKNASISSAVSLGILVPHTTFLAFLSFLCFSSYLLSLSLLGFISKPSENISSYQYDDYILPISAFRVQLFFCEQRVKAVSFFNQADNFSLWTPAFGFLFLDILKSRFPTCSSLRFSDSLENPYPACFSIPFSKVFSCRFRFVPLRKRILTCVLFHRFVLFFHFLCCNFSFSESTEREIIPLL